MRPNPKNYEAFKDPDGGEWIRMKNGRFKDVLWRPIDMKMGEADEDGSAPLNFQCEFFGDAVEDPQFEKIAGSILVNILSEMAETKNGG